MGWPSKKFLAVSFLTPVIHRGPVSGPRGAWPKHLRGFLRMRNSLNVIDVLLMLGAAP